MVEQIKPSAILNHAVEGGAPHFRPTQPPFIPRGKISVPITASVRQQMDAIRKPGETDEGIVNRVTDKKLFPTYPAGTREYALGLEIMAAMRQRGSMIEDLELETRLGNLPSKKRVGIFQDELRKIDAADKSRGADYIRCLLDALHEAAVKHLSPEEFAQVDFPEDKMRPILISGETHVLLERERRPGESDSDLFARLIDETKDGGKAFRATPLGQALRRDYLDEMRDGSDARKQVSSAAFRFPPGHVRKTAEEVDKILSGLEPEQREKVLRELNDGSLLVNTSDDAVGHHLFSKEVVSALKYLKPDERIRAELALGKNDAGGVHRVFSEAREGFDLRSAAATDIENMAKAPKLQRLGETCYHKAVEAWQAGKIILPDRADKLPDQLRYSLGVGATVFVVQHDWAAAFAHAEGLEEGEFHLPYEDIVFEFRITGRRVCCSIGPTGTVGTLAVVLNVETSVGWALAAVYRMAGNLWTNVRDDTDICAPIINLCRGQIRAICIALEAEVAETEIVRAPHRLNRAREKRGKLPIFDHHIVNLSARKRYVPRAPEPGDLDSGEKIRRRLHFVRGHLRHYPNHKVWLKWFLRGDPDLGFVDKEYRL